MKSDEQRINNLIGQLNGIKKMIDQKENCDKVLVQLQASKSAINSFINKYIENNAIDCIEGSCSKKDKEQLKNLIKQLTKNS
ncbi:MAG: metal-sensitive transcriptional regulator [Candidatus Moranbacteria bacterium]|nr:metal-sensitive transcriptional regulator [Candidatus Moranbacteria bacterium]